MARAVAGGTPRRLILIAMAVALTGATHSRLDTSAPIQIGERLVPTPIQAQVAALGFNAVVADYYWLRAVQLIGGSTGNADGLTMTIERLIDVVTVLDPWVDHPYRFAAIWLTDSIDRVKGANRILERGVAYHPEEWRNRHYLGFNHFFYLGDNERAADVLEPAVHLAGAPGYLGGLVARLRSGRDGLETAAALLAEFSRTARDEFVRAAYLKSLDEVDTERAARYLDAARLEFWKRNQRDIERVDDLVAGRHPVLGVLPRAHPHLTGFAWELDRDRRIVSSFYGYRYKLHGSDQDAERRERWRRSAEERG